MAQRIVLNSVLRNLFVVVGIVGDNKRSVLFICWTKVFLSHFRVFYKAGTQLLWHFLAIPFSFSFYLYSLLSNYIFVRFFFIIKMEICFRFVGVTFCFPGFFSIPLFLFTYTLSACFWSNSWSDIGLSIQLFLFFSKKFCIAKDELNLL